MSTAGNSRSKKRLKRVLKTVFGLGLVALLVWRVGPDKLLAQFKQVSPLTYLIGLAIFAGGEAIRTLRWQRLLHAVGAEFPLLRLIKLHFIGKFFNQFLPSSIGGDGARIFYLCRDDVSWENAVGSVLVERVVGMLMLLLVGLVAGAVGFSLYRDMKLLGALLVFTFAFGTGALLIFSARAVRLFLAITDSLGLAGLRPGIEKFSGGVRIYRSHPGVLVFVAVISLLFQLVVVGLFYYFSLELKMGVPAGYFFLFVPIILSAGNIPLSFNGVGLREWTCMFLFTRVGAESDQAVMLTILYWLLILGEGLFGAVLFLLAGSRERELLEQEEG